MAYFSGKTGSLKLTGSGTVNVGIKEWNLNVSMDVVETTTFGDTFKTYIPSVRNATCSFSGVEDSDSKLDVLAGWITNGAYFLVQLVENTSGVNVGFRAQGYLTDINPSISYDGVEEISYTMQLNGSTLTTF